MWGGTSFGALSGGVGAELSGGDFWRGAGQGATVALLNHYGKELQEKLQQSSLERKVSKILSEKIKKAILLERIKLANEGENWKVNFNIEEVRYKKGILETNTNKFKIYVGKGKYVDAACIYAPSGDTSKNVVSKVLTPNRPSNNYGFSGKSGYNVQFTNSKYYPPVTVILGPSAYDRFSSFLYEL